MMLIPSHQVLNYTESLVFNNDIDFNQVSYTDSISIEDLKSTRYKHRQIFTGTGIPMEAGQFEWRNVWLVYNQFSIGISERFSTSASLLYIPNLLDSDFDFAFFFGN